METTRWTRSLTSPIATLLSRLDHSGIATNHRELVIQRVICIPTCTHAPSGWVFILSNWILVNAARTVCCTTFWFTYELRHVREIARDRPNCFANCKKHLSSGNASRFFNPPWTAGGYWPFHPSTSRIST